MASADFLVDGAATPPAVVVASGATVALALVSTVDVRTVAWSIVGSHSASATNPVITPTGSPSGATATLAMPAGTGQGYLVQAVVNGGVDSAGQYSSALTRRAIVGVADDLGSIPFVAGESDERSVTHGYIEELNAIRAASTSGGGGDGSTSTAFLKEPVYVIAEAAITASGLQTIDGESVPAGKRVGRLVGAGSAIGIWITAVGAWTRAPDWNIGGAVKSGCQFKVVAGSRAGSTVTVETADPIVIGTTAINFSVDDFIPVTTADYRKLPTVLSDGRMSVASSNVRVANTTPAVGQTWRARDLGGGVIGMTPEDGGGAIVQTALGTNLPARDYLQVRGARAADGGSVTVIDTGRADLSERGGCDDANTTTATGTTASAVVTVASALSLKNGNYVLWHGSGPAHGIAAPAAPEVILDGTHGGGTTWEILTVDITSTWGHSPQSSITTVTTANATLSAVNCLTVFPDPSSHAYKRLVYARRAGTGNYLFAGAAIAKPYVDRLALAHVCTVKIEHNTSFAKTPPAGIPTSIAVASPLATKANGARYRIVSGGGTTTLTLDRVPRTNATAQVLEPCNLIPLENTIRSFSAADSGCGEVFAPYGLNYRLTGDLVIDRSVKLTGANRGRGVATSRILLKDGVGVVIASRYQGHQWQPGTLYRLGDRVERDDPENGGAVTQVVSAIAASAEWGASGTSYPSWSETPGATTVSGEVTFTAANSSTTPQATTALETVIDGVSFAGEGNRTIPCGRRVLYNNLRAASHGFASSFPGSIWAPNTATAANRYVMPTNANATGLIYHTAGSGTSHATTEPVWPKRIGDTVGDNGITWTAVALPIAQGVGLRVSATATLMFGKVSNVCGTCTLFDGAPQQRNNCNGSMTIEWDSELSTGHGMAAIGGHESNACTHIHPEFTSIGSDWAWQDDSTYGHQLYTPQCNDPGAGFQNSPVNPVQMQAHIHNPYQEEGVGPGYDWNKPGTVYHGINVNIAAGATGLFRDTGTGCNTVGDHAHASSDGSLEWRLRSNAFSVDYIAGTIADYTNSTLTYTWNATTRRWSLNAVGNAPLSLLEFSHYTARGQRLVATRGFLLGSGGIASPSAELLLDAARLVPTTGAYAQGDRWLWAGDNIRKGLRATRRGAEGIVARANTTSYAAGACVSQGGRIFIQVGDKAGISAASTAAFSGTEAIGDRVVDGTVYWQCWHTTVQDCGITAEPNLDADPVALAAATASIAIAAGTVRECPSTASNFTLTLATTSAMVGDQMLIRNTSGGAGIWTIDNGGVGGGNICVFPTLTDAYVIVRFDGVNWKKHMWGGL